jgi:hypothetical protein
MSPDTAPSQRGSRLVSGTDLDRVLGYELKRAVRTQTFVTLVAVEARRVWDDITVAADEGTVTELGTVVGREIRETDLLSVPSGGTLWLVLLDADLDGARAVIDRVMTRLDGYRFPASISVGLGAACCPTDAVDVESLKREAVSRPMLSARRALHYSTTDRT